MKLKICHNMEIAHRLSLSPGKCQQIHGHGMQVELTLGNLGSHDDGMCVNRYGQTMEFGDMKRKFRDHIDSTYDHRLVLNRADPFAGPIFMMDKATTVDNVYYEINKDKDQVFLPGLSLVDGDPTVENLARWIAEWAAIAFKCDVTCSIAETKTNGAEISVAYNGYGVRVVP